ncbi:MAG: hypothetical protein P4M02_09975, partial [Clostridia bacterium]|nr:hypothetical protein [Clostridia bacterium]
VEEADSLLNALQSRAAGAQEPVVMKDSRGRKPKKLRIAVDSNDNSDKSKVNLSIPLSLVRTVGPMMAKSMPREARDKLDENHINLEEILSNIDELIDGNEGEDIVNIDVGDDQDRSKQKVRIYFE